MPVLVRGIVVFFMGGNVFGGNRASDVLSGVVAKYYGQEDFGSISAQRSFRGQVNKNQVYLARLLDCRDWLPVSAELVFGVGLVPFISMLGMLWGFCVLLAICRLYV
jgi:hypothetical protein